MAAYKDLVEAWDSHRTRLNDHRSEVTAVASATFRALAEALGVDPGARVLRYLPLSKVEEYDGKTDFTAPGAVELGSNGDATFGILVTISLGAGSFPRENILIPVHVRSPSQGEWIVTLGDDKTQHRIDARPTPASLKAVADTIVAKLVGDYQQWFSRWRAGNPSPVGFR